MNARNVLAGEFIIAVGFTSWAAIKGGYWPWPGTVIRICVSFGVFGVAAMALPEFTASNA